MTCRCTRSTCGPTITRPGCPSATRLTTSSPAGRRRPPMPSSPSAGSGWNSCLMTSGPVTWALFPPSLRARSSCPDSPVSFRLAGACGSYPIRAARASRGRNGWQRPRSCAGRPVAASSRVHRLLERDAVIARRVRATAALSGRPVIEVPALPDWPTIAAAAESAVAPALRSAPRLVPGRELSRQRRHENRAADRQGSCGWPTPGSPGALLPVRVRMRDERMPSYLDGHVPRLRGQDR